MNDKESIRKSSGEGNGCAAVLKSDEPWSSESACSECRAPLSVDGEARVPIRAFLEDFPVGSLSSAASR